MSYHFNSDLKKQFPISFQDIDIKKYKSGLVIVDIINGFAKVGAGALAPTEPNQQIAQMISESDKLAQYFVEKKLPILFFQDTHEPGKLEPPYPPHCEIGTGEEDIVDQLKWLEKTDICTFIKKDCINGFVGSIDKKNNKNLITDWCDQEEIEQLIVVGICTDICVMDFVLTMLSARNHSLTTFVKDIIVFEPGCATYNLPYEVVEQFSLPETAHHPQEEAHHMGLYFMASRGAILANQINNFYD